eukprot:363221-Chlamydomonas_euryale.AAC.3
MHVRPDAVSLNLNTCHWVHALPVSHQALYAAPVIGVFVRKCVLALHGCCSVIRDCFLPFRSDWTQDGVRGWALMAWRTVHVQVDGRRHSLDAWLEQDGGRGSSSHLSRLGAKHCSTFPARVTLAGRGAAAALCPAGGTVAA